MDNKIFLNVGETEVSLSKRGLVDYIQDFNKDIPIPTTLIKYMFDAVVYKYDNISIRGDLFLFNYWWDTHEDGALLELTSPSGVTNRYMIYDADDEYGERILIKKIT